MENQHLTYFKVENFKKFDSLEVKDIGQFNLVIGDNNVGKTCLLEALLFDENKQTFARNILESLRRRGFIEFEKKTNNIISIKGFLTEKKIKNRILKNADKGYATYFYEYIKKSNLSYFDRPKIVLKGSSFFNEDYLKILNESLYSDRELTFNEVAETKNYVNNIPFIGFNSSFDDDVYSLYNNLKTKSDKENLIKTIQVIDSNIIDVELRQNFEDLNNVFLLSFKAKDEFIPVNYLGDGFKRIFYIILKVLSLKGKRIMIDEIENGIHYSRQKDFWKNIISVCNELNVQLFATTHSNECMQAFLFASKEVNEKNIKLIKLNEQNNTIKSLTYPFNEFDQIITTETEKR